MRKLRDIVSEVGSASFCAGQDWKAGDTDSHNTLERAVSEGTQEIKDWALDLIKEVDKPSFGRATDKFTRLKQLIKEQ